MSAPSVVSANNGRLPWQQQRDTELADARQFISKLKELQKNDRGRMASLRRNAGDTLTGRGTAWFYSLLPQNRKKYREVYFLVATLFDLNRFDGASGDFGSTMFRLATAMQKSAKDFRRFHILLDAEFDTVYDREDSDEQWSEGGGELAYRMRQMVKLSASKGVGVNWAELLVDLCHWSHPNRSVQKKWARSFFGDTAPTSLAEPAASEG